MLTDFQQAFVKTDGERYAVRAFESSDLAVALLHQTHVRIRNNPEHEFARAISAQRAKLLWSEIRFRADRRSDGPCDGLEAI